MSTEVLQRQISYSLLCPSDSVCWTDVLFLPETILLFHWAWTNARFPSEKDCFVKNFLLEKCLEAGEVFVESQVVTNSSVVRALS